MNVRNAIFSIVNENGRKSVRRGVASIKAAIWRLFSMLLPLVETVFIAKQLFLYRITYHHILRAKEGDSMNTIMRFARTGLALGVAMITALLPPVAAASHNNGTYDWHIGDAFLTVVDPSFGPTVSGARNGDTVEVIGTGIMTIGSRSATGGGTFVHKDSDGSVIGSGTWTVEKLLSFRSYGNGIPQGLPETFIGGRARMKVHLMPDGGGEGFDAILKIDCTIGDKIPASAVEGVELTIFGSLPNFREEVSGATLFVKTS